MTKDFKKRIEDMTSSAEAKEAVSLMCDMLEECSDDIAKAMYALLMGGYSSIFEYIDDIDDKSCGNVAKMREIDGAERMIESLLMAAASSSVKMTAGIIRSASGIGSFESDITKN